MGTSGDTKEWVLEPETEYRFELDPGTTLAIKLLHGQAEIFGAELGQGVNYLFGLECKAAVFTWQGCTLQICYHFLLFSPLIFKVYLLIFLNYVTGHPSTEYVSDETPMNAYMNLHLAFEQMRARALSKSRNSPTPYEATGIPEGPPRVLILGPENAGKTTACKTLINYAVRSGQQWAPMFINVDPSDGCFTVPGTISASAVDTPISTQTPANPLGFTATSAPTALSSSALLPLVYWYGHSEIRQNPPLLDRLIRNIGENVLTRQDKDPLEWSSGLIVDTPSSFAAGLPGTSTDKKYSLVKACVDSFQINVILVVGHEKLNVEMQRMFGSQLSVIKLPKSGGVVDLDLSYRERVHNYQIHNYMYGQVLKAPSGFIAQSGPAGVGDDISDQYDVRLSPISTVIKFSDITIYRIGGGAMAPSSALPIGAQRAVSELQPILVDPEQKGSGLLNSVLALLVPQNPDDNERYDEEILDLSVSAFLVVTGLDMNNKKMTVLMPSPGSIVGRTALMGSFEWIDQ